MYQQKLALNRVMSIDDNPIDQFIIRRLFTGAGFTPEFTFYTGAGNAITHLLALKSTPSFTTTANFTGY